MQWVAMLGGLGVWLAYWTLMAWDGRRSGWSRRKCHGAGLALGLVTALCVAVIVIQSDQHAAMKRHALAGVLPPAASLRR